MSSWRWDLNGNSKLEKEIEIRQKLEKETGGIKAQVGLWLLARPPLPSVSFLRNLSSGDRPLLPGQTPQSAVDEGSGADRGSLADAAVLGARISVLAQGHFSKTTLIPWYSVTQSRSRWYTLEGHSGAHKCVGQLSILGWNPGVQGPRKAAGGFAGCGKNFLFNHGFPSLKSAANESLETLGLAQGKPPK